MLGLKLLPSAPGRRSTGALLLAVVIMCGALPSLAHRIKVVLVSKTHCDRYSLDALYHENYGPATAKALDGATSFFGRVLDSYLEDLQGVLTGLPGRDSSDDKDKEVYMAFTLRKKHFASKASKLRANLTAAWEGLLAANHKFLANNGSADHEDVARWAETVHGAYVSARKLLDKEVQAVVDPLKNIISNGLNGVERIVDIDEQKDIARRRDGLANITEKEIPRDTRRRKIVSIVVPNFLQKVTLATMDRRLDLQKVRNLTPADRDSILDEMVFIATMIKGRALSILKSDFPMNADRQDAARHALYTYWSSLDDAMYVDRMKVAKEREGKEEPQSVDDVKDIADRLVSLFEVYD